MSMFLKKIILLYKQEGKICNHITYNLQPLTLRCRIWEGRKKIIYLLFAFNMYACNFHVPNNLLGMVPYFLLNNHTIIILFIHKL